MAPDLLEKASSSSNGVGYIISQFAILTAVTEMVLDFPRQQNAQLFNLPRETLAV